MPSTDRAPTSQRCRPPARRLLIPVKRQGDGERAVAYAIRRRAEGMPVEVCLLHVEEAGAEGRDWHGIFVRAEHLLRGLDIGVGVHVRSGPPVFSILDAAEELDCDEIVVAAPGAPMFHPWSRRIVAALLAGQQAVPVVTVDRNGMDRPGAR